MIRDLLMPQHLIMILLVAFIFFGGKKLPELGAGLGKGIKSFRDSMKEMTSPSDPEKIETPESTPKA